MYRPPLVAARAFPDPIVYDRADESGTMPASRALITPRVLSTVSFRPRGEILIAGAPSRFTGTAISSVGPVFHLGATGPEFDGSEL
jgi:hypothetical protein